MVEHQLPKLGVAGSRPVVRFVIRRALLPLVLVLAAGLVTAGVAEAKLTLRQGRHAIVRKVHNFRLGYKAGSGLFFCGRHSPNRVTCDILFQDDRGQTWCGNGAAARRAGRVRVHVDLAMEGCGDF